MMRQPGLTLCLLALIASGCDWEHFALLNSIPVEGDPNHNPVVHVLVAIDGLDHAIVQEAQMGGSFGPGWHAAKMITPFPGSSDLSWTRILRAQPLDGYELEYYDPDLDSVENGGYGGLLRHALPKSPAAYYAAFDYHANGYLDGIWSYQTTQSSLSESLDNLMFFLSSRSELESTFSGYLIELDVMGHTSPRSNQLRALNMIEDRIERFKADHPEREFVFTLVSDHGNDFVEAADDQLIYFDDEMVRMKVEPVDSFAEGRQVGGMWAVPIIHTRVSYLALHTLPSLAPEVARRLSASQTVELAIARIEPPIIAPDGTQWFGIWRDGRRAVRFGHDPKRDRYVLPAGTDLTTVGMELAVADDGPAVELEDDALFELSRDAEFPDVLYRTRTALSRIGIDHPAEVLISFERPFASRGFEVPAGVNEIANEGFHGAMHASSSFGVVLTEARALPPAVRADTFLDFFPRFVTHLADRQVPGGAFDPHASLPRAASP